MSEMTSWDNVTRILSVEERSSVDSGNDTSLIAMPDKFSKSCDLKHCLATIRRCMSLYRATTRTAPGDDSLSCDFTRKNDGHALHWIRFDD